MLEQNRTTWGEAILFAVATLWFITGLALPAPLLPVPMAPHIGWGSTIILAGISTCIWLLVPYLLIKWADRIQRKRQER